MNRLNLIVSSWPSSGGTTLSLILARHLELRYIYAGGVLKEWARRSGFDPATNAFHEFEAKYGIIWDKFWEQYILEKFSSEQGLLYEGKTAGFLLPANKAFEVMITASVEARTKRAGIDNRSETITDRDHFLQARWKDLFNVDIFSIEQINKNYNYLLDNTDISIAGSLIMVINALKDWTKEREITIPDLSQAQAEQIENDFYSDQQKHKNYKEKLRQELAEKKLYLSNEDIFQEWKTKYTHLFNTLPAELKSVL